MHLEKKITASNYLECHKWIFFTIPKILENQLWPVSAYDNTIDLSTAPAERTPAGAERSRHQLHRDRRGRTARALLRVLWSGRVREPTAERHRQHGRRPGPAKVQLCNDKGTNAGQLRSSRSARTVSDEQSSWTAPTASYGGVS